MSEIVRLNELFSPKDNQPICTFFEYFIASQDPDYRMSNDGQDLVYPFCHMTGNNGTVEHPVSMANICLGDYCKCPIAYGKSEITLKEAHANPA